MVFGGIDSDPFRLQALQLQSEAIVVGLYAEFLAALKAVIVSAVHGVSQVELLDSVSGIREGQAQSSDVPWLAELKARKAEVLLGAGSRRIEEIDLVDVDLVINAIDKIGVDRLLQVGQGFQIGDLPESEHIVVEELYPAGWPSVVARDPDANRLGINPSEVDCGQICLDRL